MLIHTITIKTFNMQKNCLTFETLFLFINKCNHKHKEIVFFSINLILKNILKNTTLVLLLHTYNQNVMILSKKLSYLKCKAPVMYSLGLHQGSSTGAIRGDLNNLKNWGAILNNWGAISQLQILL